MPKLGCEVRVHGRLLDRIAARLFGESWGWSYCCRSRGLRITERGLRCKEHYDE